MTKPRSDAELWETHDRLEARSREVRRIMATRLGVHEVCEEPACRRARACVADDPKCIRRYRWRHEHILPALKKAIQKRLAELGRKP